MYRGDIASQPRDAGLSGIFEKVSDKDLPKTGATSPTPEQVWGPFFVQGAPFRTKLSPLGAPGTPVIVKGHVFDHQTKKAIPYAVLDLWQATAQEGGAAEYDYQGPRNPKPREFNVVGASKFNYRAKALCDGKGYFEIETIMPAPYLDTEDNTWRCSHIHFFVASPGYKPLVTQLYFKGKTVTPAGSEDHHAVHVKELHKECALKTVAHPQGAAASYYEVLFDLVIEPKASL
eukprot:TRINITY_DN3704_c0_g1_i1.p1 TRINITY_DN3704_c0_g1~~TRINITY_DN3704_c0_g1_i1.p1  ORF type:complete len:254 (+),score=36.28 TRINITY_DN3704_c0_g1_i1:67-762(+)